MHIQKYLLVILLFQLLVIVKNDTLLPKEIKLSLDEHLMQEVESILPKYFEGRDITSVRLTQVRKKKTTNREQNICNIIRAPNHQPYQLIKKLAHEISNKTDWYRLVLQQFVIYKLEDIKYLHYALDMEVIDKNLVVAFPNGDLIFYKESQTDIIKEVSRQTFCEINQPLMFGKIAVAQDVGLLISDQCIVLINSTNQSVRKLSGFQKPRALYTAIIEKDNSNINIFIGQGRSGITHYTLREGASQITKVATYSIKFQEKNVIATDFVDISKLVLNNANQKTFLILDRELGIVKIELPKQGGQVSIIGERTNMTNENCRILTIFNQQVYTSCPQVVKYNPKTNSVGGNPILSQLPIQMIEGYLSLSIISHNSFQNVDQCSGAAQQGFFQGDSFHHTVRFGNNYISIDQVSLIVWNIRRPKYFLACKGNKNLIGTHSVKFAIYSICKNQYSGSEQCCSEVFEQELTIYDSKQGYHMLQIVGLVSLMLCSGIAAFWTMYKRRRITQEYNQLLEQSRDGNQSYNLSMIQQKKEEEKEKGEKKGLKKEISVTEQSMNSEGQRRSMGQELKE